MILANALLPVLDVAGRLLLWLLLAPLLPGIVNRVKARVAGRRGPPVLQLYYDLAKREGGARDHGRGPRARVCHAGRDGRRAARRQ